MYDVPMYPLSTSSTTNSAPILYSSETVNPSGYMSGSLPGAVSDSYLSTRHHPPSPSLSLTSTPLSFINVLQTISLLSIAFVEV